MGCTVREKHIRTSRRSRSMKPTNTDVDNLHHHQNAFIESVFNERNSALAKSVLESGFKPWAFNMGFNDSMQNSVSNPNNNNNSNPNSSNTQSPSFEECGWGYCTEDQLEEILLKQLEFLYNEAVSKLIALGYNEEVALKGVLKNGHCYGSMDVLTNILQNTLAYLNSGCCGNDGGPEQSDLIFPDLTNLEEYSLAGMICLLQQVRPNLSRGDAMWCLLMSDLHVGRASTIEIPMLSSPSNVCGSNAVKSAESVSTKPPSGSGVSVTPGLCKFHGGWGFGNGPDSDLPVSGFGGLFSCSEASIEREIDFAKRFNLNPSLKSLLKRNVAAFAAGYRSKQKLQVQPQPCTSPAVSGNSSKETVPAVDVPSEPCVESNDNNQDNVNSIMSKFRDLNLGENLESVTEEQKDDMIVTLLHQVKDLEKQVNERKEWAHQKAMQAARKLSSDLTELKTLRTEREETQRVKKGKQTLEDSTMKRLSEMENALRKASAEMEASKLSASESVTTCLEVAKREKKCLKRLLAWEKQKMKMQEEIAAEKQKISDLQQQFLQIIAAQKEAEAKWKKEVKEKDLAVTQVEEERRSKEATEGNNKRKVEALRLRIDIDFQRHKDDLQRLEQELSRLKASSAHLIEPNHDSSDAFVTGIPKNEGETIARLLLRELDEPEKEEGSESERECLICMKEEVSVVFLPCAHQVMCANCGEDYGKKGKETCPCCRCPIEQRIRVFGASS
ncbi:hypothetical protein SOVF_038940 [Spinacia oleracea]|nr:hypothetical protein SOVF_038940 [Spinacia oleracea]